jgi:NADH-quinone oxidoreductase subunit G
MYVLSVEHVQRHVGSMQLREYKRMINQETIIIDNRLIPINGERNLLELVRKANINLPTFCYHSDLSVYGACRLCLVDVEGRGIMGACSTPPEPNMKIRTQTEEIREIRKISIELLLANHDQSCPTCLKSASCQLQSLARQLGIDRIRFKPVHEPKPIDYSSPSLVRDPNKCVLCGDCVRVCSEIQDVGAIDFAFRGHQAAVLPALGKDLADVECVNCGQCASACPTGSLAPKSEIDEVWKALLDPTKIVIAQVAPAVRVGLGESFGMAPGTLIPGQMVAALKMLGFNQVFDTSFAADMTVIEEGTEFIKRKEKGEHIPLFTSCCPAWVKFAEQYFPELLSNLSTCRSPQQMFGSLLKETMPISLGIDNRDLVVVAIMPCTAKKFEAKRPEFTRDGIMDVDNVLTTQELAQMINAAGICFNKIQPESFDMPFGFTTGAGVIFGNSGGVTEAVLRFASEKVTGKKLDRVDFQEVRGESGLREAKLSLNGTELKLAVVHGLKNARVVAEQVTAGKSDYDLVEVMACPGGCIAGAGQPITRDPDAKRLRTKAIYQADKTLQLHKSQDNVFVTECYEKFLGEVGGDKAHKLLHTDYQNRRRIADESISLVDGRAERKLPIDVCLGTSCYIKGSQEVLQGLIRHSEENGLENMVDIRASFCFENCSKGPTVAIGDTKLSRCSLEKGRQAVDEAMERLLEEE